MDPEPHVITDQPPEVIRRQIEETRSDLTAKLERLEEEVKDTVGNARETVASAKEAVEETFSNVKETVRETVESVKRTFDVEYQVCQRPWTMLALSAVGGFAVGYFVIAPRRQPRDGPYGYARPLPGLSPSLAEPERAPAYPPPPPPAPPAPGLTDRLRTQFDYELDKVKGLAIGALMGVARDYLQRTLPPALAPTVAEV